MRVDCLHLVTDRATSGVTVATIVCVCVCVRPAAMAFEIPDTLLLNSITNLNENLASLLLEFRKQQPVQAVHRASRIPFIRLFAVFYIHCPVSWQLYSERRMERGMER